MWPTLVTMIRFLLILLVIITSCLANTQLNETVRQARDSYIDAYHDSHGGSLRNIDRESKYSPHYDAHAMNHYGPPNGYPEAHYPSPAPQYGPPVYGPPQHVPSYPAHFPLYEMPHAMLGLLDKFHLKLNIFTILKLLLKLVLFKKLVSFIAIICLLLFIPKFKIQKEDSVAADDPDARKLVNLENQDDDRLNNLTSHVLTSIEKFSGRDNKDNCEGIGCAIDEISEYLDNKYTYSRLFTMYAKEA